MYKAIVFAGTTEGYALCEFLAENRVSVYACAATEYGGSLLQENEFLHVSAGRLKTEDMEELFRKENPESFWMPPSLCCGSNEKYPHSL